MKYKFLFFIPLFFLSQFIYTMEELTLNTKEEQQAVALLPEKDKIIYSLLTPAIDPINNNGESYTEILTLPNDIRRNIVHLYNTLVDKTSSIAYNVPHYWIMPQETQMALQYLDKIFQQNTAKHTAVVPLTVHTAIQQGLSSDIYTQHIENSRNNHNIIKIPYRYKYDDPILIPTQETQKNILKKGLTVGCYGGLTMAIATICYNPSLFMQLLSLYNASTAGSIALAPMGFGSLLGFLLGSINEYIATVERNIKMNGCIEDKTVRILQRKKNHQSHE